MINFIRQQRRDQSLLMIGIVFGLLGSFLSNAVDRLYIPLLGTAYDFTVIGISLIGILLIMHFFNKDIKEIVTGNQLVQLMMKPQPKKRMKRLKVLEIKEQV